MQGKSQMLQQNAAASGLGIPIVLTGAFGSVAVQVWGTFVGTINFEVTLNGIDWVPASGQVKSASAPGIYYFAVNGVMQFRANIASYTSGNINAFSNALEETLGDSGTTVLSGSYLQQTQVGTDQPATFANSAAVNTQITIPITAPLVPASEYELIVYNPSTVTDLTVKVFNTELAFGGGSRDALLTTFSIPKSQAFTGTTINTYIKLMHGAFNGGSLKLVVSNDTVLGAADTFTASVRLRAV